MQNSKTLVGIVTFGCLDFTKLAYRSIKETTDVDIVIVVGKPGDRETALWAAENQLPHYVHDENYGFPYSLNDIYDHAWKHWDYENLIIMGNDVIAYPNSINKMIEYSSEYEWVCAKQLDVNGLIKAYPQIGGYFQGEKRQFSTFHERPWEIAIPDLPKVDLITPHSISDVQNLCLYKKSVFEKIGYTDVNFYPAYYIDNDYARRGDLANIYALTLGNAVYFHFWSRTLHQGNGGSNNHYFDLNKQYYITKWGGDFTQEKYTLPFNGQKHHLFDNVYLEPTINIQSRENEKDIVRWWRNR